MILNKNCLLLVFVITCSIVAMEKKTTESDVLKNVAPNLNSVKINLVNLLLTDPINAIKKIGKCTKTARDMSLLLLRREGCIASRIEGLEKIWQIYEEQCPIFLLEECDSYYCCFNRKDHPYYRKYYERTVCQEISKKITSGVGKNNPVVYTSFGCGGMLEDMFVLAGALTQHPDAQFTIHLIDKDHDGYVRALDTFNISRQIALQQRPLGLSEDLFLNQQVYEKLSEKLIFASLMIQKKGKQMLALLADTFPRAKLALYIHDLSDSYFNYLEQNGMDHADILVAADIENNEDNKNLPGDADFEHYKSLCVKTLEKRPNSANIWLSRENDNKVEIKSFLYNVKKELCLTRIELN